MEMISMNSRERVLKAFRHEEPDRVPMWCGASPEFMGRAKELLGCHEDEDVRVRFHDDFRRVFSRYSGPAESSPDACLPSGATFRTPFGVVRRGYGYGQPLGHILENASLKDVMDHPWPDPDWIDVSHIRKEAVRYHDGYAVLGGEWSPFFHDAIDLLGMESFMVKMYDEPEIVDEVIKRIVDYYAAVTGRIFEEASDLIDIYFIGNDFGSQNGPIMGEGLFRRFMAPHLKRLSDLGHKYGKYVMVHCCGGFAELIPAMIEAGVDALQSLQPSARGMDYAQLKKRFGDRIVLNGCVDTQHVLINGTPGFVREKTKEILQEMKPGGGFVLSPSHDYLLEETPVENVLAMYDTGFEYGRYAS